VFGFVDHNNSYRRFLGSQPQSELFAKTSKNGCLRVFPGFPFEREIIKARETSSVPMLVEENQLVRSVECGELRIYALEGL